MEKKRSKGVIIYGISLLVISFLSFGIGIGAAIATGPPDLILRALIFFAPLGLFISSIGLLMLRNWARYLLTISASVISLLLLTLFVYEGPYSILEYLIESLILFGYFLFLIGAIYFFTRPKVKEQFRQEK